MEKKELYAAWIKAKKREKKANQDRTEIEKQIELLIPSFDGASTTIKEEGFIVKVKKNEKYSFDQDAWKSVRQDIPADFRPEKIKFDVDTKGLEYLKVNNSEVYAQVSDCVTYKIGKTSFTIEKE